MSNFCVVIDGFSFDGAFVENAPESNRFPRPFIGSGETKEAAMTAAIAAATAAETIEGEHDRIHFECAECEAHFQRPAAHLVTCFDSCCAWEYCAACGSKASNSRRCNSDR